MDRLDAVSSCGSVDLDNDGFEDLVIGTPRLAMNRVFWNRGGLTFREITVASGAGYVDEPIRFKTCDLDQNGAADLLYLTSSGAIRRLEASGNLNSWIQVVLKESAPGMLLRIEVRDADWIVRTIERTMNEDSSLMIGLGDAATIESLAVFDPNEGKPLQSLEKLEPNQQIRIELPKRPKKRPVVPLGDS